MGQSPVLILLVRNSEKWDAETLMSWLAVAKALSPRERADRLYDLGELAAAADLLEPPSVN